MELRSNWGRLVMETSIFRYATRKDITQKKTWNFKLSIY